MRLFYISLLCAFILISPGTRLSAGEGHFFRILAAPEMAKKFEIIEIDFNCEGVPYFDPRELRLDAIILPPVGNKEIIPAYWTQPFGRGLEEIAEVNAENIQETRQVEKLKPIPAEPPHWRVRYSPSRVGTYQVELRLVAVKKPELSATLWQGSFLVTESQEKGFLRRNPSNQDYLRFDDGSGYFAIGYNICWPPAEKGVSGYLKHLDKLQEVGGNYTRFWLCTWGFTLETSTPYLYDLAGAWAVEEILREAEKRGIRVKLCIDNAHDFTYSPEKMPYLSPNGPCLTEAEFFTSEAAREIYRAKLRYLIARYGAFTSLYAWELWNEIDYTLINYYDEELGAYLKEEVVKDNYLIPWTAEMLNYLQEKDPYNHLRTTSLGINSSWDRLWRLEGIDIVQMHSYIRFSTISRQENENDATLMSISSRNLLKEFNRPTLLAEFGYNGTNDYNPLNAQDPDGIALHNALWAGAFSGHSGTPMSWWWDNYLEPNELLYHYSALSNFLEGVDWTLPKQTIYRDEGEHTRVMVLADNTWTGIWVQNKASTWENRLEGGVSPQFLSDVTVKLSGFENGHYLIEWIDTYTGKTLTTDIQAPQDGGFLLSVPTFDSDIAARLILLKEKEHGTIIPGDNSN